MSVDFWGTLVSGCDVGLLALVDLVRQPQQFSGLGFIAGLAEVRERVAPFLRRLESVGDVVELPSR